MSGFLDNPADLNHLQMVNPKDVIKLVKRLNTLTPKKLKGQKLVVAIGTGGTIAMKIDESIARPDLNFQKLLHHTNSDLTKFFHIESLDAFSIDSSQMKYRHVQEMAVVMAYIYHTLKVPFIGFLVTHGTDTMAYTAAALSLMMGRGLPFSAVYTGAQKPIQEPMNDAGINIRNALFTLDSLSQKKMAEIVIVMAERAMIATSAVKVDDTSVHAFDSPLHKYISKFSALEYPIRLASWLNPRRTEPFVPKIWTHDYSRTLIVHSRLGLNPSEIKHRLTDPNIKAILLFSYGTGSVHEEIANVIAQTSKDLTLPMFVVNPVDARYRVTYQSSKDMIEKGVVSLYMTLPSALAKIEIALEEFPNDIIKIGQFMTENYVGEVPDENSRFRPILER